MPEAVHQTIESLTYKTSVYLALAPVLDCLYSTELHEADEVHQIPFEYSQNPHQRAIDTIIGFRTKYLSFLLDDFELAALKQNQAYLAPERQSQLQIIEDIISIVRTDKEFQTPIEPGLSMDIQKAKRQFIRDAFRRIQTLPNALDLLNLFGYPPEVIGRMRSDLYSKIYDEHNALNEKIDPDEFISLLEREMLCSTGERRGLLDASQIAHPIDNSDRFEPRDCNNCIRSKGNPSIALCPLYVLVATRRKHMNATPSITESLIPIQLGIFVPQ